VTLVVVAFFYGGFTEKKKMTADAVTFFLGGCYKEEKGNNSYRHLLMGVL
jgi:hypothetical protein